MGNVLTKKKKNLSAPVLRAFNSAFLKLSFAISDGTDEYAFYRGEIYEQREGIIGLSLVASNVNGDMRILYVDINQSTGEFQTINGDNMRKKRINTGKYDINFKFNNEKQIYDAIMGVVEVSEKLHFPLSQIFFEVAVEGYRRGCAEPDPHEKGSYIMYIFSEEKVASKFGLASALKNNRFYNKDEVKELCGRWGVGVHNKDQ